MILSLLEKIVQGLESFSIPYMVSGSFALNTYTIPRMTRDIDIVIHLPQEKIDAFIGLFAEGFYIHAPSVVEEIARRGMFNVIDHQSGYKVDFIVRKESEYRQIEFERRTRQKINGFEAYVVSLEDLILSKLIWIQQVQSERQMQDIANLIASNKPDRNYLSYWINKLSIHTFGLL
jgi:hypothetical protein